MRRLTCATVALSFLLIGASVAAAADWEFLGDTTTDKKYYLSRIERSSPTTVRTWIKVEYGTPTKRGETSTVAQAEYDCQKRQTRTLAMIGYGPTGPVDAGWSGVGTWEAVFPDSIGEAILERVCSK
jgi:hypothetical protein